MKYNFRLLCFISLVLILYSCSKSNEEDLGGSTPGGNNPPATCVTSNMQYSVHIAPLIQTNCFACHSNANMSVSGISLEGYNNLKAKVTDGRLLGAITHAAGFSPMPQGGPKLSDCNINRIKAWIDAGAPNN